MVRNALIALATASFLTIAGMGGCPLPSPGARDVTNSNGDGRSGGAPAETQRADGARLLYRPDDSRASAQNVAFSPDGTRIVFTVFENGYNEGPAGLWVADGGGANARRITPDEDQDNVNVPGAAWNALRDEIVFASDREEADDLWVIRPDGTGLRRITSHVAPPYWIEPVWSPDGQWIVFEADIKASAELAQRGTIFKVRADGSELTQLTRRGDEDLDDRLPNWSPDGNRILFQRRLPKDEETGGENWDVYVIDTHGDGLLNVSNARQLFNTDNSWSPDAEWIASSSAYQPGGTPLTHPAIFAFFVPDSVGSALEPQRITFTSEREDGAPSVSPDGRWVAFESHRSASEDSPSDLWIIAVPER